MVQSATSAILHSTPGIAPLQAIAGVNATLYDNVMHRLGRREYVTFTILATRETAPWSTAVLIKTFSSGARPRAPSSAIQRGAAGSPFGPKSPWKPESSSSKREISSSSSRTG